MFKVVIGFNHVHIYGATIAFVVLFLFFFLVCKLAVLREQSFYISARQALLCCQLFFFFFPKLRCRQRFNVYDKRILINFVV